MGNSHGCCYGCKVAVGLGPTYEELVAEMGTPDYPGIEEGFEHTWGQGGPGIECYERRIGRGHLLPSKLPAGVLHLQTCAAGDVSITGSDGPPLFTVTYSSSNYHKQVQEFHDPAGNLLAFKPAPECSYATEYPQPLVWKIFGTRPAVPNQASTLEHADTKLFLWGAIAYEYVYTESHVYVEIEPDGTTFIESEDPFVRFATGNTRSIPLCVDRDDDRLYQGYHADTVAVVASKVPPKLALAENVDPIVACALAHAQYCSEEFHANMAINDTID